MKRSVLIVGGLTVAVLTPASSTFAVDTLRMAEVKQIMTCGENQRAVVRDRPETLALQVARLGNGQWQIALGRIDDTLRRLTVIPSVYHPDQTTGKAEFMLITRQTMMTSRTLTMIFLTSMTTYDVLDYVIRPC